MHGIKFRGFLTDTCPLLLKRNRGLSALHIRFHNVPRRTMATAMGRRLEGKTILITGASSGIGQSTGPRAPEGCQRALSLTESSLGVCANFPQKSEANFNGPAD